MALVVREFKKSDAPACSLIVRKSARNYSAGLYGEEYAKAMIAENTRRKILEKSRAGKMLVAQRGGKIVGMGLLLPHGKITTLRVAEGHGGTGVGSALLEELKARARELGLKKVFLAANEKAEDFYAKRGFKPLPKSEEKIVAPPSGQKVRLKEMVHELK